MSRAVVGVLRLDPTTKSSVAAAFAILSTFDCGGPASVPFKSMSVSGDVVCPRRMKIEVGVRVNTVPLSVSRDFIASTSKLFGVTSVSVKDAGDEALDGAAAATSAWTEMSSRLEKPVIVPLTLRRAPTQVG